MHVEGKRRLATPWNSVKFRSGGLSPPLRVFGEKLTFQSSGNDPPEIDICYFSHPVVTESSWHFRKCARHPGIMSAIPFLRFGCSDATINPSLRRIERFADEYFLDFDSRDRRRIYLWDETVHRRLKCLGDKGGCTLPCESFIGNELNTVRIEVVR